MAQPKRKGSSRLRIRSDKSTSLFLARVRETEAVRNYERYLDTEAMTPYSDITDILTTYSRILPSST